MSELTNKELDKMIALMASAKKSLFSFIDRQELINFVLEQIDTSGILVFERERNRKFISVMRPSMDLLFVNLDNEIINHSEFFVNESLSNFEDVIKYRTKLVHTLVSEKVNNIMNMIIRNITLDEIPEGEYEKEWLNKLIINVDENTKFLLNNINIELQENGIKNISSLSSNVSAIIFPPEGTDINVNKGFTIEFMF